MRLSPVALAVTAAFVWGAAIFIIGSLNALVPGYGDAVLALVVSIYPGYDGTGALGDLLLGTAYAFFDGLAGGFVFALLYNAVLALTAARPTAPDREQATSAPADRGEPHTPPADAAAPAAQESD